MKKRVFALAAICALALAGCGGNSVQPAAVPAGVAVQVQTVERRDVATENRVSGSVTSDNETSIYVSSTAKCTAVYFEAGDTVEEGDVICTLDLGSTLASYNAAKISYDSAATGYQQQKAYFEKQVELLQKQIENTKALFEIGAASQLEIDNLEVQLLQLEATRDSTLSQLRAGMENYRSNLEQLNLVMDDVDAKGNVIAPASGTLASLTATEGGFVSASYPVAVISDAEQMKVTVYVSEALVPKLTIGDAAHVSVTSAGAEFTAVVRSVEQTANMQTKLYAVVLSVPSDVTGLISGMFADVTFFTETAAGAVAVPSEAILTANGEQYVYVVENDAAKRTAVKTGLTGDGVTEVLSGLKTGEKLVVVGQQYLSDGDAVRVVSGG
ncbi:MAG: efflux RND transporter periplasmic adaptor subunit [Oscillospiraceae bacterium]|nr:efflux RND transporter periplasmic adaptor subunit [Oscillospiraceae bacterium]